jgi:delta24(24(1))-sterol reductase
MTVNLYTPRPPRTLFRSSRECGHTFATYVLVMVRASFPLNCSQDASPNAYAWKVYTGLVVYQLFLAWVMPGFQQEGLPVPSLGYKTLVYNCNALYCLYATMLTAAGLHYYHIFRLTEIIDNYGHIMSVAMIYGFAVSFGMYFITVATGNEIRMSGSFIYDVFMGACLNPRIGSIDLKMWAEVRIPWVIVFFLAVSGGCQQYEQYGYVTPVRPTFWSSFPRWLTKKFRIWRL